MTILDLSFPYVAQYVFTLERWGFLDHMSPSLYSLALSSFKNILFSHLKLLCIIVKHPSIAELFNAINKSHPQSHSQEIEIINSFGFISLHSLLHMRILIHI